MSVNHHRVKMAGHAVLRQQVDGHVIVKQATVEALALVRANNRHSTISCILHFNFALASTWIPKICCC